VREKVLVAGAVTVALVVAYLLGSVMHLGLYAR
jgi:hypothetical protein